MGWINDPVFKEAAVHLSITRVGGVVNAANAVVTKEAAFVELPNKSAISSYHLLHILLTKSLAIPFL